MNLLNMKIARLFIKKSILILYLISFGKNIYAWEIDFSRREKGLNQKKVETIPWPSNYKNEDSFLDELPLKRAFSFIEAEQIISILHTEEGFIPNTLRLKKEVMYKVYIVNVNEKVKNASFILDSFGQSFGIYFGKTKNFELIPKVEGNFEFISPESGAKGKVIVYSVKDPTTPLAASEGGTKK